MQSRKRRIKPLLAQRAGTMEHSSLAHRANNCAFAIWHDVQKTSRGKSSRHDASNTMTMGAAPSHSITMGYVSDPFRTEEQRASDVVEVVRLRDV